MDFQPFRGLRYDDPTAGDEIAFGVMDLSPVIEGNEGYSASRLAGPGGRELFREWQDSGVLARDEEPSFYLYRSGGKLADGEMVQGCGVIGVVEPGSELGVTPAVVQVDAPELVDLIAVCATRLLGRATDGTGVHHRLWRTSEVSMLATIRTIAQRARFEGTGLVALTPDGTSPPSGLVFFGAS